MVTVRLVRKQKYWLNAVVAGVLLYLISVNIIKLNLISIVVIAIATVAGVFVAHYPNLNISNILLGCLLPINLLVGSVLSFRYFPNISVPFKLASVVVFTCLYYVASLADNIFLVVDERKESITLYRVALTWGYILAVIIAIPVFAGIFKISTYSLVQSLLVSTVSVLFGIYLMWAGRYDTGVKTPSVGESLLLLLFLFTIMLGSALVVSFFPAEAFLRALFLSSVLMFMLNFLISGYLKNEITKKMITEYIFISILFLIVTLIFD